MLMPPLKNAEGQVCNRPMFLVVLGLGLGEVMLTLVLTCTFSARVHHFGWVGYGDVWCDVHVRFNLQIFLG